MDHICVHNFLMDTNMTRSIKRASDSSVNGSGRKYRQWPVELKRKIVAETYQGGESVSMVARRHDVNANQVFRWRHQFRDGAFKALAAVGFVPVDVVDGGARPSGHLSAGMMTIVLPDGISIRVDRDVDDTALQRVLSVIARLA